MFLQYDYLIVLHLKNSVNVYIWLQVMLWCAKSSLLLKHISIELSKQRTVCDLQIRQYDFNLKIDNRFINICLYKDI